MFCRFAFRGLYTWRIYGETLFFSMVCKTNIAHGRKLAGSVLGILIMFFVVRRWVAEVPGLQGWITKLKLASAYMRRNPNSISEAMDSVDCSP